MKLLLSSVVSSAASLLVAAFCTPRNCLQKQFIRATSSTAHTFSPRSSTGLVLPTNTLDSIQRIRAGAARSLSSTTDTDDNDNTTIMSESKTPPDEYVPPKVWIHDAASGGKWAKINRPESGALHQKELPVGKHPLQLYSWATPNGIKATIMLEELLELGITEAEYDAWLIRIDGDQFGSGFVELNPNSKIPALMDHTADADADADTGSGEKDQEPLRVFESGSILMYLGDKFGKLIPPITDWRDRTECMNWVMWQMGSAPFVGGGFGYVILFGDDNQYAWTMIRKFRG
jgi:glutathione S-transferase